MKIFFIPLLFVLLTGCVPMVLGLHITEGGKFTTDPIGAPSAPTRLQSDCYGAAGCVTYQVPRD